MTDLERAEALTFAQRILSNGDKERDDRVDNLCAALIASEAERVEIADRLARFRETTRNAIRSLPDAEITRVVAACRNNVGGCFCGCHVSQVPA